MILVTGGAGYVGSALVAELLRLGEPVRVVDVQWFGNPFPPHALLEIIDGDVRDFDPAWLDDVDAVCHLAALSNDPTADFMPGLSITTNVLATRVLAQMIATKATREQRPIRCLFASTCSVYYSSVTADWNVERMTEDTAVSPTSNYSKSKRLAEVELLKTAQRHPYFCPAILRKGTVFGVAPRMRFDLVVNALTLSAWSSRTLTVNGSGEAWRPLLHIQDAVDAYIYMLAAPPDVICGRTFNLLHKNYRVLELAHWVAEVLEKHKGIEVRVRRDRSADNGVRSYYVDGSRLAGALGIRAERGTTRAILEIWEALERGDFGADPVADLRFFNIRCLQDLFSNAAPELVAQGAVR